MLDKHLNSDYSQNGYNKSFLKKGKVNPPSWSAVCYTIIIILLACINLNVLSFYCLTIVLASAWLYVQGAIGRQYKTVLHFNNIRMCQITVIHPVLHILYIYKCTWFLSCFRIYRHFIFLGFLPILRVWATPTALFRFNFYDLRQKRRQLCTLLKWTRNAKL